METFVGLVMIAVLVAFVRAVWRTGTRRHDGLPPSAGSHDRGPRGPQTPNPMGREAEFPPETVDDAFAVGYIVGRHHGQSDVDHPADTEETSYDGGLADDSEWGSDDWSGDDGGDE